MPKHRRSELTERNKRIHRECDISRRILRAINKLQEKTRAKVITPERETEYFEVKKNRAFQGDTIALYIFVTSLVYVMHRTFHKYKQYRRIIIQREKYRPQYD